jgi:hypothetical protein
LKIFSKSKSPSTCENSHFNPYNMPFLSPCPFNFFAHLQVLKIWSFKQLPYVNLWIQPCQHYNSFKIKEWWCELNNILNPWNVFHSCTTLGGKKPMKSNPKQNENNGRDKPCTQLSILFLWTMRRKAYFVL